MTLADKVRQLRKERGWTQLELAKKSGVNRGYIANLEGSKSVKRPSAFVLLKLARAFRVRPEDLYVAAGYINEPRISYRHGETPEELLDRLRIATPHSIPVYDWEHYPFHAGNEVEPREYIYRTRNTPPHGRVEAYFVHGDCLEPIINSGDIIIVDHEAAIDNNDIVACVLDGKLQVLRVKKVAGDTWLESNRGRYHFEECQYAAPVIECIRRLK